ncbi:PAS domain-containing protein [Glycocaulis sp.]|uniref:hybrid sensor histidine kinase/response regulator n=1 Tax=Glycocaulis sp. TaxID=1969725 RepID=UPI003F6FF0E0
MLRALDVKAIDAARLFDIAPNPYVLIDRDFVIVGMNEAYLSVTGRTREAIAGRGMFEAFPSDPQSVPGRMLRTSFRKVFDTGQTDHLSLIPYPIARPDGTMEERFWSATNTPVLDEDGRVAFILQHTTDVTELHLLRQEAADRSMSVQSDIMRRADAVGAENLMLGEEGERLRDLFEQAPGFMAVLTGPDHVFTLANGAYVDLVGERALIGRTVREALPDIEGQGFFELLDGVYTSGEPFIAHDAKVTIRPGGTGEPQERFVDLIYHPVRDRHGDVSGIFVQGHDTTAKKAAQEAASESEARFRTLAQSLPNHVWTATPDGQLDWFNQQVYDYTGEAEHALDGANWGRVVHPDDFAGVVGTWQAAIATGQPYLVEFRLRNASGEYRWHIARATPRHDQQGQVVQWVGTNTDIHEQKRIEESLAHLNAHLEERVAERTRELLDAQEALRRSQQMEAIGNLAGGVAHDFNNLLQVISGNLQLLGALADSGEDAHRYITAALEGVRRGASLTDQLLSFGRRKPLEPRAVAPGGLVLGMEDILKRTLGEAIEIRTVIEPELWNAMADPLNVENAILNLAINARDAMGGHGRLTLRAANARIEHGVGETQPGDYVMIEVSDTGQGMSEAVREKAFEPFFTTKPEGKGTGLGLSMVYGFARQSGGCVTIDSTPGEGTSVAIYLPRTERAVLESGDALAGIEVSGGTETVLIAEDDAAVLATAAALFEDLGYTVVTAHDAQGALDAIKAGARPDLLFTDVIMPGPLKSTDLARQAQALLPGLAVLFTSGYAEDAIVQHGRLTEGVHLLGKPYSREALAIKVRQVLNAAGQSASGAPARHDPPVKMMRVLLCEDDPLIRLSTSAILESLGMAVVEAADGRQALAALGEHSIDILVTDMGLPDMNGRALADQVRQSHPGLPVLFATGRAGEECLEGLEHAGLVAKPYDELALDRAIRRLTGSSAG